jgi:hypothetical protein
LKKFQFTQICIFANAGNLDYFAKARGGEKINYHVFLHMIAHSEQNWSWLNAKWNW